MNPNIIPYGFKAYEYAVKHKITDRDVFIFIDFSLPSNQKRLYVVNKNKEIVYSTYVTHGAGSGKSLIPTKFSNTFNSHMSSLGVYKTLNTYVGKHGVSRQIAGLESTNNNALKRSVVIHSASYIGGGRVGTSWGCFAVPEASIEAILDYSKPGTLIIAYYPDSQWLHTSVFLNNP